MAPRRGNSRWIVGILAFAVVLFFLFPQTRQRPLSLIEVPFVWVAAQVAGLFNYVGDGVSDTWYDYLDLRRVRIENRELATERDALLARLSHDRESEVELVQLRELLAFKQSVVVSTVSARVIGGDATRWFQSFLLDRGSVDGVRVGDGVIAPSGAVGRVAMVTHHTAQVLLVGNRSCVIPARLQRNRQAGILKGGLRPVGLDDLDRTLLGTRPLAQEINTLNFLPRNTDVKVGDRVVTSGLEGHFPAGIPIGPVAGVSRDSSDMFAKIYVVPATPFSTLEQVLVVIAPETE